MSAKIFRLITGDDVIGDVTNETETTLTVKNPARFVVTNQGVGLMPLSPFSKGDVVTLKQEHVMFSDEPEDEIYSAWSAQYGSGLVLPSGGDSAQIAKTLKLSPK